MLPTPLRARKQFAEVPKTSASPCGSMASYTCVYSCSLLSRNKSQQKAKHMKHKLFLRQDKISWDSLRSGEAKGTGCDRSAGAPGCSFCWPGSRDLMANAKEDTFPLTFQCFKLMETLAQTCASQINFQNRTSPAKPSLWDLWTFEPRHHSKVSSHAPCLHLFVLLHFGLVTSKAAAFLRTFPRRGVTREWGQPGTVGRA